MRSGDEKTTEPDDEWWRGYWKQKVVVLEGLAAGKRPAQSVTVMAGTLREIAGSIRERILNEQA